MEFYLFIKNTSFQPARLFEFKKTFEVEIICEFEIKH